MHELESSELARSIMRKMAKKAAYYALIVAGAIIIAYAGIWVYLINSIAKNDTTES